MLFNIGTLYLLWTKEILPPGEPAPPPREGHANFINFLREDLQFSDSQIQDYEQYRERHAVQTRELTNQIQDLKRELHNQIFKEHPNTIRADSLAEEIGKKQSQIEKITFAHFLDLKKLCGEEQQEKLHALLDEFHRKNSRQQQSTPPDRRRPEYPPPGEGPRN